MEPAAAAATAGRQENWNRLGDDIRNVPYSVQYLVRLWLDVHASRTLAGVFNAPDNLGIRSLCQPYDRDEPVERTHCDESVQVSSALGGALFNKSCE